MESAEGVRLRLADGRELVDGMSSWWAAIHGYRHPVLDAALHRPAGPDEPRDVRRAHPRARRSSWPRTLVEHHPGRPGARLPLRLRLGQRRGGGQDVPAVPARRGAGRRRQRLATWRGGYHGDTFHPMSVCDPDGGMHSLWTDVLPAAGVRRRRRPADVRASPTSTSWPRRSTRHARRAGRGDRRAGRAGRRRDALPPPGLPAGAARAVTDGARRAADLRRDRDRLRPHRRRCSPPTTPG